MIASVNDVESLDHPGLELYRTLRRSIDHRRRGIFVVEGNKVVVRFLASGLEVVSILLTESWLAQCRHDLERRPEAVTVYRASGRMVRSIVGFNYHQGIMAVGKVPPTATINSVCTAFHAPRLFVALDHMGNTENTGVILRNCAACGVQAIISGETSTDPYLRRSVRNSMGAVFRMPVVYSDCLAETLAALRIKYGFTIVAAHVRPHSVSMHAVDFTGDCCIVLGNEQSGVSDAVVARCDRVAAIPMHDGVDSFNVGCASAIMLYEAFRQRRSAPPTGPSARQSPA
ncbi:MAG: RNA methyltransferase [Chitinispirillaceae bacterium]|nr:RNA methyltransferase [Chitinispirillaceae bacterium]